MSKQQIKNLSGQRFGRLKAISYVNDGKNTRWLCQCDCGNEVYVLSYQLTGGKTKSCGCMKRETPERFKCYDSIQKQNPRLHTIWSGMKQRCFNPKSKDYKNYGARGITVCDEWKDSFQTFCSWSKGNGYSDSLTIDRIDPNGNYCPENCRWIPLSEQSKNTRLTFNNRFYTINGITKTYEEWAEESGISVNLFSLRVSRGMSEDKILLPAIKPTHRRGKQITINGVTKNITQWCKEYRISYTSYLHRINRGLSEEDAITTPKEARKKLKER